nr:pyrroline-5-carboxylate reductase [Sphingomicrobium sediminis]
MSFQKILLVGCGKMGSALLEYWKKGDEDFTIVDPAMEEAPDGVRLFADRDAIADETFDVVILAIKPQLIHCVMPDYAANLAEDGYVLSIAAGASIRTISNATGTERIIRVMPNLPAAIGKGASGLTSADAITVRHKAHALDLMSRTGGVVTVADEDALDRVTAVAGSGPGYVFEFARAYVDAASQLGIRTEDARKLVLQTMAGTIALALDRGDQSLAELRDDVTSKGGTTAAGLKALNGSGAVSRAVEDCLAAAYGRAVQLR